MKIVIKYTNVESTTAIDVYINEKFGLLAKVLSRWELESETQLFVEVGRTTKHHHKGPVYKAEVNMQLPGKLFRAERENWDMRIAIDEVKNILKEQIAEHNDRQDK
ncbi:MAG: HPF/RaiA family ribosome-associated protein [bacterium]|nr:HPF/RaiA family ribosome-associated protein [bacterium]